MRRFTILFFCLLLFASPAPGEAASEMSPVEIRTAKNRQRIAEVLDACGSPTLKSEGERFAVAMQDYWQKEIRKLWRQDQLLNQYYLGAKGSINVTDKDCGLIRDSAGNPLRISRDTCYPWKLTKYNTLDKLAERLKLVPEFGATRGFAQPASREGGWIYDEIVRGLLGGEVNHPETEALYLPEHAGGNAGFAVLYKRGNTVRWYGPDCCRLMSIAEGVAEERQVKRQLGRMTQIALLDNDYLPSGLNREDFCYLRVSYQDVDFNLDSGQGGVYAFGKGQLDDFTVYMIKYYLVSPCGLLILLDGEE